MTRTAPLTCLALAAWFTLSGCQMFRLPRLPKSIKKPTAHVDAVELIEHGPDADRFAVVLTLTNPNDQPLPLVEARYNLHVEALGTYKGQTHPNAVVPANASQTIRLPAAIALPDQQSLGRTYRVGGSVQYHPPGELRNLTYDVGLPLPSVTFVGNGTITSQVSPPPDTTGPADADQPPARQNPALAGSAQP